MIIRPRKMAMYVAKKYFDKMSNDGINFMDEDWDNCIIIDACRYDTFKEKNTIPGDLKARRSKGSSTFEVFEKNFQNSTHHDTVYITANPVPRVKKWCKIDLDEIFHEVIDVWEKDWDEDYNTVRPEPVKKSIINAHKKYPNKRILGHFIQPHQPFIGKTGEKITERGMRAYDHVTGQEVSTEKSIWEQLEDGDVATETVWTAYRENLELVLPHVSELCKDLSGKTIVTSDHGNMFGKFMWPFPIRGYGHPPNIHTKELITVPWLELPSKKRRKIKSEEPELTESPEEIQDKTDRLSALGYY